MLNKCMVIGHLGRDPEMVERFLSKVDTSGECWTWRASTSRGYGQFSVNGHGSAPLKAHRVAYELFVGPIPDGLVLCHACDNPSCVRPSHLLAGTQADNLRGASARGRLNPTSLLNLRPGAQGRHGAGPQSRTGRVAC